MESTNKIIETAVQRWLPVILSVLAGVNGSISKDTAIALACYCEAEDNARYARALVEDLDNVDLYFINILLGAAEKYDPDLLKHHNPDVYTYWAQYWRK